jgi:FtsP/CotA-like multicopper oxidase with cupredoxin domain
VHQITSPDTASGRQRNQFLSTFAAFTAIATFLLATATIVAVSSKTTATTSTSSGPISVTLSEYTITPKALTASAGSVQLAVHNGGTMAHNLAAPSLSKLTRDLQPGENAVLDLGQLKPGTYAVQCTIPGHSDSGMTATLTVTAAGAATGSSSANDAAMPGMDMTGSATDSAAAPDYAAMDKAMEDTMKAFPATTTGVANVPLVPTIAADGAKVFDLKAAITDWEVEPGKTVKAWTYNGTAPGPWIKVNVGDHVRVNITNDLPAGTDIHFHGIDTPFAMDGVAPITQPVIAANGGTFTYDFTLDHPMLGMYHAHHMGNIEVPNGLFGVFEVGDMAIPTKGTVSGLSVPAGLKVSQEIPIVLNDAGVIGLSLNGKSFPATAPIVANNGDWIEVSYFNEGMQVHPMHLHKFPQIVIAKDGLPLDSPYAADTILVGPGERYTVLIHADSVGTWVWHCHILNHVERNTGMFGMVTALVVK